MYFIARHNSYEHNPGSIVRRCEEAYGFYPYNYYFCMLTAETAFNNRFDYNGKELPERIEVLQYWCDKGLTLNPYKRELRTLKRFVLKRESLSSAIKYWENYVEWNFWDPDNHAVLVDLYAQAGNFGRAMESLRLAEKSEHYEKVRKKLHTTWQKEITPPDFINDKEWKEN
ncbi:tetratricopeptide repeat protein [Verrucomicrobiota bacterium]